MVRQTIVCFPVEITIDPRESDEEENEPTEEEIKAAMALLNRSKKRKEKLNTSESLTKSGDESKVTTEDKVIDIDYPQVLGVPLIGAPVTGAEEVKETSSLQVEATISSPAKEQLDTIEFSA